MAASVEVDEAVVARGVDDVDEAVDDVDDVDDVDEDDVDDVDDDDDDEASDSSSVFDPPLICRHTSCFASKSFKKNFLKFLISSKFLQSFVRR